jgi:hypothetical protein
MSEVAESVPGAGAGAPPTGQFGPERVWASAICGTTYPEAGDGTQRIGATCACGTFAIGICTECGEPVCGNCSVMAGGKRVHRSTGRARAKEKADREAKVELAIAEDRERRRRDEEDAVERAKSRIAALGKALGEHSAPGSVRVRLRDKRGMADQGPWKVWPLMELTPPTLPSGTDHAYLGPAPEPRMVGVDDQGKLIQIHRMSWLSASRGLGWPVDHPWMKSRTFPWDELTAAAERCAARQGIQMPLIRSGP